VANYQITIAFNDVAAPLIFDLPDTDLDTAETIAAGIRDEVEQGRDVNAPVVTAQAPDGSAVALEPGRIVSIDLQEVTPGE
jgi:hypothetical protein